MKYGLSSKLIVLSMLVAGLIFQGCASPPPTYTIYSKVDSDPPGADVYWGTDQANLTNKVGTTPYSSRSTGTRPYFYAGYYKVVKRGYKPAIKEVAVSYATRSVAVVLEDLPRRPEPPAFVYPSVEEVAVKPLDIEANRTPGFEVGPKDTIAVMAFDEPAGSGAGSLVADNLILALQVKGYNVVDREQIERLMREQGLMADGKTALTDLEISRKLGKLLKADYIIYGAITEYVSKSENVQLSPIIDASDRNRYQREYDEYVDFYDEFADDFDRLPTMPKTLREWEFDAAGNAQRTYINIARVGVTAKIVNVASSDIVWVGFASLQDLRIQRGMRRIVEGMTYSFLAPQ